MKKLVVLCLLGLGATLFAQQSMFDNRVDTAAQRAAEMALQIELQGVPSADAFYDGVNFKELSDKIKAIASGEEWDKCASELPYNQVQQKCFGKFTEQMAIEVQIAFSVSSCSQRGNEVEISLCWNRLLRKFQDYQLAQKARVEKIKKSGTTLR